jgi:hypothetical protein
VINAAVGSCDVLLALIGEEWLSITDREGQRRLDDPDDYVRLEIEAAMEREVRVIPILVEGATMPLAEELPPSLARLVRRQALELSPSRFDFDISRLLKALDKTLAAMRAAPESDAHRRSRASADAPGIAAAPPDTAGGPSADLSAPAQQQVAARTEPPRPDVEGDDRARSEQPGRVARRWRFVAAGAAVVALVIAVLVATGALDDDDARRSGVDAAPQTYGAGGEVKDLDVRSDKVVFQRAADDAGSQLGRLDLGDGSTDTIDSAPTYQGIDVGTNLQGHDTLVYSRCADRDVCDLYRYSFGGEPVRLKVSSNECREVRPSIDDGEVLFSRDGPGCRSPGLYLKRTTDPQAERIGRVAFGADFNGRVVAALRGRVLSIATPTRGQLKRIEPAAGHGFKPPLVLDGGYLYLVDVKGSSYSIARVRVKDKDPLAKRYRPAWGAKGPPSAPRFGVTSRGLYQSGYELPNGAPSTRMIVSDDDPRFGAPLPLSRVQASPAPGRASGDSR